MRVVAGELRGRPLLAPDGLDTRPTTDRVREAVFNALASLDLLDGARVLDLFAGSGAMGIEALSRGAAHCRFVERDRRAVATIRENVQRLGVADRAEVVPADAVAAARGAGSFDLVLADPPYEFRDWAGLLATLDAPFVVAESGRSFAEVPGWDLVREKRYGRTFVAFFERSDNAADDELP